MNKTLVAGATGQTGFATGQKLRTQGDLTDSASLSIPLEVGLLIPSR